MKCPIAGIFWVVGSLVGGKTPIYLLRIRINSRISLVSREQVYQFYKCVIAPLRYSIHSFFPKSV